MRQFLYETLCGLAFCIAWVALMLAYFDCLTF